MKKGPTLTPKQAHWKPKQPASGPSSLKLGALVLALALSACASGPTVATSPLADAGRVEVRGRVQVQAGSRLPKAFQLLQAVVPLAAADVKTLRVYLERLDEPFAEMLVGTLPGTDLPIELRNLRQNAEYRVRLEADDLNDVRIDNNATSGGSPELGLSSTLIATTNLPLLDGQSFRLQMADVTFNGSAAGSVDVTPGVVKDPIASEETFVDTAGLPDATELGGNGAILRSGGTDYLVDIGHDGFAYIDLSPFGISPSHLLPLSSFDGCGLFFGDGQEIGREDESETSRIVVMEGTLAAAKLGFAGALDNGSVISLPVYSLSSLLSTCSPP